MIEYLTEYQSTLKQSIKNMAGMVSFEVMEYEDEVRKWIKERWLLGERPDGSIIGVYRNPDYAMFKQRMNPKAGGDVDLTLTESLGDKIEMIPTQKNIFKIISTDSKYSKIVEKYGEYNFNLSEEKKELLFEMIGNQIINKVLDRLWAA
jgi:hypothetical protein